MHVHPREHNERDCQPNHNKSDSGDEEEEEEDLPGLLPSDLHIASSIIDDRTVRMH